MNHPKRLIVGISGASGAIYGVRLLQALEATEIETHVVISKAAQLTLSQETDYALEDIKKLSHTYYNVQDIGAAIASGSFATMGMVILPCSIKTMGEIATGITTTLLSRAADVALKERRRLVLAVRESPLHLGHLRTMANLSEMGAIIAPPMPAFYPHPKTVDDIIDHTVGRILDLFQIDNALAYRWHGVAEEMKAF